MSRVLHLTLFTAGALLLGLLVHAIGLGRLADDLRGFGLAFVGVVACELLIDTCNALGWRQTFGVGAPVPFWRLFWIRQAGTAVNQLTPTATLGGEMVKAMLLRPHLPLTDALVSLLVAKVSFAIAQSALVLLGLAAVLARLHASPGLALAVVLTATAILTGVLVFLLLQRRGVFAALAHGAWKLGLRTPFTDRLRARAAALDARLATFHRDHPRAFARSILWHFAGQLIGLGQLAFILFCLGTPVTLATCLALEAFALVVDSAVFFVPGRLGVQEGGRVLVFAALGLGTATGLAVAVIVRLTQLATAAIGLAAFGYFSLSVKPVVGSISET